ncbi:MAG: hypothetical protein KAG18_03170 [Sinobacterium sp.]|nr:hypothetical protein [Sinobacterium sp.]
MSLIDDLKRSINPILAVRDNLGAHKHNTYLIHRKWTGESVGNGKPIDKKTLVAPSPNIVDLSNKQRNREGGRYEDGTFDLKMISKQTYPERESFIPDSDNEEIFFLFNNQLCSIEYLKEDHLWWNVRVIKRNDNRIYV